jgi:hypothetical protein
MTPLNIKSTLAALAVALALGSPMLAASPVQAGSPSFGFSFEFGNDGFHFGDEFDELPVCMTDRQIRRAIRDRGYHDIYLNVPDGRYIQVKATKGKWVYIIKFNFCSNDIVDRYRLRRS